MILLIFGIIFLLVVIIYYVYISYPCEKERTIKEDVTYSLATIDHIFTKHGIWYVGAFGTLLGAIRHWDMIPWDDDGDVIVKRSDVNKILSLAHEFSKYGMIMESTWKIIKIYPNGRKYPFVDIFIYDDVEGKAYRCHEPYSTCNYNIPKNESWWWNDVGFPFAWLRNRHRAKFGNITIWVPDHALQMLKYWYGEDVLTKCMSHNYDHVTSKYVKTHQIKCANLPAPQLSYCREDAA